MKKSPRNLLSFDEVQLSRNTVFFRIVAIVIFSAFTLVIPSLANAADDFDAQFLSVQVPSKMAIGQPYAIKLMVKNTGKSAWTSDANIEVRIKSDGDANWENVNIRLSNNDKVLPESTYAFETRVRAPQVTGLFQLRWQMSQRGRYFGDISNAIDVVVEASSNSRSKFVSQVVPQNMSANQEYPLVIQFKNQSGSAWRSDDNIELVLVSNNAKAWNVQHVKLEAKEVVPNGDIATFNFSTRAPATPGKYPMQWRISRDGSNSFGEVTPMLTINVADGAPDVGAEFVFQNIPGLKKWIEYYTIFDSGKVYNINLTFKNIGRQNWNASDFRLLSREANAEITWSIDQVDFKPNEIIRPGEIKSFIFKVIAPLTPGIYPFQWQLQRGRNEWVGEPSDKIMVTVR